MFFGIGLLAANTYFRFHEAMDIQSGPFNIVQGFIDFSLTRWLGNTWTAMVLAALAVVIPLRSSRRSYEDHSDTSLRSASSVIKGQIQLPWEQKGDVTQRTTSNLVNAMFLQTIRRLGWVFIFAGCIPTLISSCEYATGIPTNATVIGIEMHCLVKRCKKCETQNQLCALIDRDPGNTYYSIKRMPYAKVRFEINDGEVVETKAAFPKLGLSEPVSTGQSIRIRYRSARPTYVSSERLSSGFTLGIGLVLLGVILIFLNRYFRSRLNPQQQSL